MSSQVTAALAGTIWGTDDFAPQNGLRFAILGAAKDGVRGSAEVVDRVGRSKSSGTNQHLCPEVSENFASISGRSLSGKRILDFGCGYGRILRSMLYFSDPADLYGCDPWDRSRLIDLCKQDGLTVNLALSEYLPTHLPFTGRFDLIYAFSVFTHLSLRATRQCLDTLHGCIGENGVLVITVRPVEYWAADPNASQAEREQLVLEHNQNGFAFRPHRKRRYHIRGYLDDYSIPGREF